MSVSSTKPRPGVGIAVIITSSIHPNCIVLGKRKGSTGPGLFQLPGGHLEFGETWEEAAIREVLEETGQQISNAEVANMESNEPQNLEPNKCEGWQWVRWEDLPPPETLFWALRDLYKEGRNPFIS